jgi:hypothetical protein
VIPFRQQLPYDLDDQEPSTSGFNAVVAAAPPAPPPLKKFPTEALAKQGVAIQDLTVPRDMMIPTNSADQPPISLRKGQRVMVIRTPKGIYLRMGEKIIKIRLPPGLLDLVASAGDGGNAGAPKELVTIASSDSSSDKDQPHQDHETLSTTAKELFKLVASATSSASNSPKPAT